MPRKGGSLMQQVKSILFPWKLYFLTQALQGFFYSLPCCYPLGYITHKNSPGEKWVFSPIYFLTSISQPSTSSVQAQWGKLKSLLLSGIKTGRFRWTKVVKNLQGTKLSFALHGSTAPASSRLDSRIKAGICKSTLNQPTSPFPNHASEGTAKNHSYHLLSPTSNGGRNSPTYHWAKRENE